MRYFKTIKILMVIILLIFSTFAKTMETPQNVIIKYKERSLDIFWDSIPAANGYNIYTSEKSNLVVSEKRRVNKRPIISGSHFTYLWDIENHKKIRKIKGYHHNITITALYIDGNDTLEGAQSIEYDNCYYDGFDNMITKEQIQSIIQHNQETKRLPFDIKKNNLENVIEFFTTVGKDLQNTLNSNVDFRKIGGCAPISTILVKIMDMHGIYAYRADGTFIKEFHSFVILSIDSIEYIADFTANQFIPNVSPVLIPRDYCHLNANGRFSKTGINIYTISKIYSHDQIELTNDPAAQMYKNIFERFIKIKKEN